jgi:hypothetical protein
VVPAGRWAPYGVPVRLLGDQDAACRGTRARDCPVAGHPCLTGVSPGAVVDAVAELTGVPEKVGATARPMASVAVTGAVTGTSGTAARPPGARVTAEVRS